MLQCHFCSRLCGFPDGQCHQDQSEWRHRHYSTSGWTTITVCQLFKARQRWSSCCPHDTFRKPVTLILLLTSVLISQCWPMKPFIVNRRKRLSDFVHNTRRKGHTNVLPKICPTPTHKLSVGSVLVASEMEIIETIEPEWYTLLFGSAPVVNWCR